MYQYLTRAYGILIYQCPYAGVETKSVRAGLQVTRANISMTRKNYPGLPTVSY
jgi:hypothetical protein